MNKKKYTPRNREEVWGKKQKQKQMEYLKATVGAGKEEDITLIEARVQLTADFSRVIIGARVQ